MRTISNYKALALLPDIHSQLKALHQAASLDLTLPNIAVDMVGARASEVGELVPGRPGVKSFGAAPAPRLTADAIKAHLARKWATPGDNPILTDVANRVESFFHSNMPEIDLGWMNLFTAIDLRGSNQDNFDITTTHAGITFNQVKPGGAVKIRREISEASTPVPYLTFSDGIGLLDDWLRYQKFWRVEEVVAEFRAQAWNKQAGIHYGLFTALSSGVNQAFATNDTTTFNNAAAAILRAVEAKGYAAGQNARFWIVCSPERLGRILTMLQSTYGSSYAAFQSGAQPLAYSVAGVIATTHVTSGDTGYYLVLPGRKIQRGTWLDLQIESTRDIYASATDWVGKMQFNAIIGDSDQVKRVLYS